MAKKELIDSGASTRYGVKVPQDLADAAGDAAPKFVVVEVYRQGPKEAANFSTSVIRSSKEKAAQFFRNAKTGAFVSVKEGKKGTVSGVRRAYSMPNGDKIVTVRRDIVDRAIGRKKK